MEYFTTKTIEELNNLLPAIDLFYRRDNLSRTETNKTYYNTITTEQLINLFKILTNQKQPPQITLTAKLVYYNIDGANKTTIIFNGYVLEQTGYDFLLPLFLFMNGQLIFSQIESVPEFQNIILNLPTGDCFEGRLSKLYYQQLSPEDQTKINQCTVQVIFCDRGLNLQHCYPQLLEG